jgi:hypothetical protein
MSDESDKSEITVNVEVSNDSTKTMLVAAVVVVVGIGIALTLFGGGDGGLFGKGEAGVIEGNCGDGADNDGGGQADQDDPDCYHEPEVWKGYDANRSETTSSNDPPQGRP